MEALSQLDIPSPDHVSVITRDGKMTVSITKDGSSITVSMPIKQAFTATTLRPPLHQGEGGSNSYTVIKTVEGTRPKPVGPTGTTHVRYRGPVPKLTELQVREIKMILADKGLMSKFKSRTQAYREIGKAYEITGCSVSNIARGISWKDVTI